MTHLHHLHVLPVPPYVLLINLLGKSSCSTLNILACNKLFKSLHFPQPLVIGIVLLITLRCKEAACKSCSVWETWVRIFCVYSINVIMAAFTEGKLNIDTFQYKCMFLQFFMLWISMFVSKLYIIKKQFSQIKLWRYPSVIINWASEENVFEEGIENYDIFTLF